MANQTGDMRTCPTRIDRAPVLFAHRVLRSQCSDRQRDAYHKCYTCAYNHAQVEANGLPDLSLELEQLAFAEESDRGLLIPHVLGSETPSSDPKPAVEAGAIAEPQDDSLRANAS